MKIFKNKIFHIFIFFIVCFSCETDNELKIDIQFDISLIKMN